MKATCRTWTLAVAILALAAASPVLAQATTQRAPQAVDDRRAEDQYNFATELFSKKFYELAIQQYEKFLTEFPNHSNAERVERARIRVGESYLRLGKNSEAAQAYAKVLAEKPTSKFRPEILVGLGLARFNLKDFAPAAEALAEAQKLTAAANDEKLGPVAANWLGECYYAAEKYADAAAAYQGVQRWPNSDVAPQALYSLGFCQLRQGQDDAAVVTWLQVVDRYKTAEIAPEANYRAGEALLRKKSYALAEKTFKQLLTGYPNSGFAARAQLGLGWIAFNQQDYPTARAAFDAVGTLFPNTPQARDAALRAADASYYMDDFDGAAKRYEAVVAGDDPAASRQARYWLAMCRLRQGQKPKAKELLGELAADKGDPALALKARTRLADLQLADGENAAAAESYRAALAAAGGDAANLDPLTYSLALALYRSGKPTEAEAQFAAILQRGGKSPTLPLAALGLAQCRMEAGQLAQAAQALRELLTGDATPETRAAGLFLLGQVQLRLNNSSAAIVSFKEVVEKHADRPQAAPAAGRLALLYREARPPQDAEADRLTAWLVTQAARDPAAAEALLSLADNRRQAGDFNAAITLYQKVIGGAADPGAVGSARGGLAISLASVQNPDVERVNTELRAMVEAKVSPATLATTRYLVGWGFERGGRLAEGLEQYRAALAAGADEKVAPEIHLRCGTVLSSLGRFTEAIEAFRVVLDKYPGCAVTPDALYELGWSYKDANQGAEATKTFERLVQGFPEHPLSLDATFRVAEDLFKAGDYAAAAPRYRKVADSPASGKLGDKAWYKLGWCLREMKDARNSAVAFARLVSLHPNSDLAQESRLREAEALIEVNDLTQATARLQSITASKPANDAERQLDAQARVALAGIYVQRGETKAAYETAQAVATSAFRFTGSRAQLVCGEAKFAEKQWEAALKEFVKVTSMRERSAEVDAQAQFRIGECCDRLKDRKNAENWWQAVIKAYPDSIWAQRSQERLAGK